MKWCWFALCALATMMGNSQITGSTDSTYQRALQQYQIEQKEAAKHSCLSVLSISPYHEPSVLLLSRIYKDQNNYDSSRKVLDAYLRNRPENCLIYLAKFKLYIERAGRDAYASSLLESALHFCNDEAATEVLQELALNYFKTKAYLKAGNAYQELLELAPHKPEVQYNVANYYSEVGRYIEANELLTQYLDSVQEDMQAGFQLAFNYLALEQYPEAIEYFTQYLSKDSSDIEAWYNRGIAYAANKQYNLAIEQFDHCLQLQNDYWEALYNKAMVHQNKGAYNKANQCYTEYIQHNLDDIEAYHNRGLCKYYSDDPHGACGDWKRVQESGRKDLWKQVKSLCKD